MHKIIVKPSNTRSLKIITVFKKETFLGFSYWNAIERVLCSNQAVNDHTNHFTSKYNIVKAQSNYLVAEEMRSAM